MASSPAYTKHPDHKVDLQEKSGRVHVEFAGEKVADSRRCWLVLESRHDAVVYFPREDVRMDLLEKVSETSFCPFKGTASYWTIDVGGRQATNAVWSYEEPFDQVSQLTNHMAFYLDRVDAISEASDS
jgi:uncharacterized protein (DUF427 family)